MREGEEEKEVIRYAANAPQLILTKLQGLRRFVLG